MLYIFVSPVIIEAGLRDEPLAVRVGRRLPRSKQSPYSSDEQSGWGTAAGVVASGGTIDEKRLTMQTDIVCKREERLADELIPAEGTGTGQNVRNRG